MKQFHQAGIPRYILLAELAMNFTPLGDLPRPAYLDALRQNAPAVWWSMADLTLGYAKLGHARHGLVAQCAGLVSTAGCQSAHAILADRGQWVTNEKQLLTKAGLRELDDVVSRMTDDSLELEAQADRARSVIEEELTREGTGLIAPL